MKKLICGIFLIMVFSMTYFQMYAQDIQSLIEKGDSLLEISFENQKAFNVYLEAYELQPENWEVNWRLSRVSYFLAEQMPESIESQKEAKLQQFKIALDYAEKAIKFSDEQTVAYLYRALVNSRIAFFSGIFSVSSIMNEALSDISKVIKINNAPPFFNALCYFVLGRIHFELCEKSYLIRLPLGLGWANINEAIISFKKAIEIYPEYRLFHLYIAKTYIELKQQEKAEKHLLKIFTIKPAHFNDDKFLTESKLMLDQINK